MKKISICALPAILTAGIIFSGCTSRAVQQTTENKKPLVIAQNGSSSYQIILPDKTTTSQADKYLVKSANLLRDCIKESSGANLPVLREAQANKAQAGIYLGNTKYSKSVGVNTTAFSGWTWINKAQGRNLIIAGHDFAPVSNVRRGHYGFILGTAKGITAFLKRELGVRFVLPGKNGIHVPKHKKIIVSGNLNIKKTPNIKFIYGRRTEMFYEIANNFLPSAGIKLYGGHSYYSAVPTEKYSKKHPEYFILQGGVRNPKGNHLCISNPKVQDLIYREMLNWLDKGYSAVELAQTDGYKECECGNCKKYGNTKNAGEKLWILHRKLAERLKKDRPGKKVIIISYGPTVLPPKTFKTFPDNVIIELCSYSPENFQRWSKCKVPGGFLTYIYNWGYYQAVGLTPKRTPNFSSEQVNLFFRNKVQGVYLCGFGELFGLEGPSYYAYGRSFDNHESVQGQQLLDEYCRAAFGKAYVPMTKFYDVLFKRLELYSSICTPYDKKYALPKSPRVILAYNYSPDVLKTMESNLRRAEKDAQSTKVKKRLALVRKEFDYVKNLASIIHLYNAYRTAPDWQSFNKLADFINQRNQMINAICPKGHVARLKDWPNITFLGGVDKHTLKVNGRLQAPLSAPFNWDTKLLKKKKVLPGLNQKKLIIHKAAGKIPIDKNFDSGIWKAIPYQSMNEIQMGQLQEQTRFKMAYDTDNLYIAFNCTLPVDKMKFFPVGRDGAAWGQECLELFIDPYGNREKNYHFIFNPVKNSYYDAARGFIKDQLDPQYDQDDKSWNGKWFYYNWLDRKNNTWKALVQIPFKSLQMKTPGKGTIWLMNIGREHYFPKTKKLELSLWSPNLEAMNFHEKEAFGEVIFDGSK
jgi:hypothetical protein